MFFVALVTRAHSSHTLHVKPHVEPSKHTCAAGRYSSSEKEARVLISSISGELQGG